MRAVGYAFQRASARSSWHERVGIQDHPTPLAMWTIGAPFRHGYSPFRNCNAFLEMNPDADVVFVDTQHLPGAPPLDRRAQIVADLRMR